MRTDMQKAALAYIRPNGKRPALPVFPCIGKVPYEKGGFHNATTDEATVRAWWIKYPNANIGIPTGEKTGMIVLDIDEKPAEGKYGMESYNRLVMENGEPKPSWEALTGGGGIHKIFAYPEGATIPSGASSLLYKDGTAAKDVDVRANGGYIIVPPSIHPDTGREYCFEVSSEPFETELAYLPAAWVNLLSKQKDTGRRTTTPQQGAKITEGQRNSYLTSRAGKLQRDGLSDTAVYAAIHAENEANCSPQLERTEVDNIVSSILRYAKGEANMPEPWGEPEPLDKFELPPFPAEALPPVLRKYCTAVSESTQTPIDAAGCASLAVMALCCQGKYEVEGKRDWTEPLNLYILNVAPPAERKSAVLRLMTRAVYDFERQRNSELRLEVTRYQDEKAVIENEIAALQKSKTANKRELIYQKRLELDELPEVRELRLIADDSTPEQLSTVMSQNNERIAVISAEGGLFDVLQGRYSDGKANMEVYLKAHSGDPIRIDRRGRTERMENPCLTMLLSVQPQVIDGLISNATFRGRGLTARFLYSFPPSALGARRFDTTPICAEVSTAYSELVSELLAIPHGNAPDKLTLTDDARKELKAFFETIETQLPEELESIQDFAGKLPGAVLRIAAILHVAEQFVFAVNTPIPGETMNRAIELGEYLLAHAKKAYAIMGADETTAGAKYAIRQLQKQDKSILKRADIHRACRSRFGKVDELIPVIDTLIDYGYLREVPAATTANTGRPPEARYELNPLYFTEGGRSEDD